MPCVRGGENRSALAVGRALQGCRWEKWGPTPTREGIGSRTFQGAEGESKCADILIREPSTQKRD